MRCFAPSGSLIGYSVPAIVESARDGEKVAIVAKGFPSSFQYTPCTVKYITYTSHRVQYVHLAFRK